MDQHHISFRNLLIGVVLLSFSACSYNKKENVEAEPLSSANPLIQNYRVRAQKVNAGNIIVNPSFELGKVKQIDSLTQSIQIDGWEFVGKNVRWLKSVKEYEEGLNPFTHTGSRSIKVTNENTDETDDMGSGVISNFIRVIPGNYTLSLYLNLKNVTNPKSRLGTLLHDAVDIRVMYYDRNKLQIDAAKYSPYHGNSFDNTFKGLSLVNFERIDSSGWLHIHGRSHDFPVPDGDLQDDTKFVRVFVGLKGNGEMYIDDVSLEYNRLNLTMLERIKPYFDSTFSLSQLIIPQPRTVKPLESIIFYRPYFADKFPLILVPENADIYTLTSAEQLNTKLRNKILEFTELTEMDIPDLVVSTFTEGQAENRIVFSIGNTSVFEKFRDELPLDSLRNHPEGFFIYSLNDEPGKIFINGSTSLSTYYATQAAVQLFDNKRLLFHNANVIDYPHRTKRSVLIEDASPQAVSYLSEMHTVRFNSVYLPAINTLDIALTRKFSAHPSLNVAYYISPESSGEMSEGTMNNTFANVGTRKLLVFQRSPFDHKTQPGNSDLPSAPLDMLLEDARQHNASFTMAPLKGENYRYEAMTIETDKRIDYAFSADGIYTWKVDEGEMTYFTSNYRAPEVFVDFTLYPRSRTLNFAAYDSLWPHKLPLASVFEPYSNEVVPEIYNSVNETIIAAPLQSVFDQIRLQTASDFLWNPTNYDPDLSLYMALITEFGAPLAEYLISFNDLYFKARSELILAANPKNMQRHLRRAAGFMTQIESVREFLLKEDYKNMEELVSLTEEMITHLTDGYNNLSSSSLK